jgi:integrase
MKLLADLKVGRPDCAFLFSGKLDSFIDPDTFNSSIWSPIAARAGMEGTRFHDLRHFYASHLIANKETPSHVREQMGHSSIKVTFDTYGHLFPGSGKAASSGRPLTCCGAKKASFRPARVLWPSPPVCFDLAI